MSTNTTDRVLGWMLRPPMSWAWIRIPTKCKPLTPEMVDDWFERVKNRGPEFKHGHAQFQLQTEVTPPEAVETKEGDSAD